MTIRAVSHIALGVPDIEAALPFYRDLLGLGVVVDRKESFVDPSTDPPVERTRRAVYSGGATATTASSSCWTNS